MTNYLPLNFHDPDPNLHDIVLIVQEIKFYCSKKTLAKHSPVLYTQLCMDARTKNKTEMTLSVPSKAKIFNVFLNAIHGVDKVNSWVVKDLMKLAVDWEAKVPIDMCLGYLRRSVHVKASMKFEIAMECGLEEYKKEVISSIKSPSELKSLLPKNLTDLDHPTMALLLEKSMELHGVCEQNHRIRHPYPYSPFSSISSPTSPNYSPTSPLSYSGRSPHWSDDAED